MGMSILNIPFIAQTRRSHALEHATIQILNRRYPTLRLMGWSTPRGFYLHGHISSQAVRTAVTEALARLHKGESQLAIHPRCGTNLVTAGTAVGLIAFLTMLPGSKRSRRERLPLVLLLSTLALMFAQPLGPVVQEYITTESNLAGTQITEIERYVIGQTPVHSIQLDHGDRT
jgi:hypothetical protein